MTQPHHFTRMKLSRIASYEVFQKMEDWYLRTHRPNLAMKYKIPFADFIYKKTADRFYLSKWLEKFIIFYLSHERPDWEVRKVNNSGERIIRTQTYQFVNRTETRVTTEGYRKNPNQIIGEPDIKCMRPMMQPLYFEIKIGNDRLSQEQKDFIAKGFGVVEIIRTLDEFVNVMLKY
jgi:hypothetical protein